jgi:hypothetical protein
LASHFNRAASGLSRATRLALCFQTFLFAVEVSGPPNLFAREGLAHIVEDGSIIPRMSATVRFRIRTICPGAGADTFVRADISQQ